MKVVVRIGGHERDLDVVLRNPEATLGELLEAVTGRPTRGFVHVGDRAVPASTPLLEAGVHEGAVLSPDPDAPSAAPPGVQLVVSGGLDAGLRVPLARGTTTVGRSSAADVVLSSRRLSQRHVTFRLAADGGVRAHDEGSRHGTTLDGRPVPEAGLPLTGPGALVLAGGAALSVRDERLADRPLGLDLHRQVGRTGTVPVDRPPRAASPPPPDPVTLPARGAPAAEVHVPLVLVLVPLLLAVVAVAVTGDLRLALLGALGPVLGLGTYLEQRRRATRADVAAERDVTTALATLDAALDDAAAVERARLQELCPDPAELLRRAGLPSVRLWERRPDAPDFLVLHGGVADLPWTPPVDEAPSEPMPEVVEVLARPRLLSAPVAVHLAHGGVVGVVGDRAAALAVARSLLCQAAVQSGPADLTVGVFVDAGREAEWEWAKWLPHTRAAGVDRWVSSSPERSDALLRALLAGHDAPALLVVLDAELLVESEDSPALALLGAGGPAAPSGQEHGPQVAGIVLAATEDRLPATCTTVIRVGDDGDAVVRSPQGRVSAVLAAGLSVARARQCARDLARFDDPEPAVAGGGLPEGVRLLPLLDLERVDADAVRRRWQSAARLAGLAAPVGVGAAGVVTLDLVRDGPHGLVAGTTGSGRSEFLRSLVVALAAGNDPTRLALVLVDVAGGAALDGCSRLPHTVGTVTAADAPLAARAVRALEAELHHRERLFTAAAVEDHAAYVATGPAEPMPRLLLVVDELAALADDVLTGLLGVATAGRRLGVHLVLATRRPAGAVTDDVLGLADLRVALRVQTPPESSTVVGVPDAALIGRDLAGRAYLRVRGEEVVAVQTALVTCVTREQSDAPVGVRPFVFGPPAAPTVPVAAPSSSRTDLERLVDAVVQAAADAGTPPSRRLWPESTGARRQAP